MVGASRTKGRVSAKMKQELFGAFGALLKPERVKSLRITHAGTYIVLGFLLTTCPVENRNYLKDFEAHLSSREGSFIDYAVVDGKKLVPSRPHPGDRQHKGEKANST